MKNNDVELIQRVLAGDETAFSTLVQRYQKQVHALAWRKIGDFHIAEEITQDTFLKAYQKLATLKQPHRFTGWVYVIATRCCHDKLRKKQIETESLDEMVNEAIETDAYSRYVAEQETKLTVEAQRGVVKRLLAILPESERTVITLHYFGEMTCERMSEFLGVSVNTIKSRLRRARNRLKKEEPMIREAISNFQISPNLTENIMKEITRIKLTPPVNSKPVIPWVIGVSSAVLMVIILGIRSQYVSHFQKPYSLDAQSEMAVDIVDAPIVQDFETKPDIRNQQGKLPENRDSDEGNKDESNHVLGDQGNYTRWSLPEKAKLRLGKGVVSNYEGNITAIGRGRSYHFTPDSLQFLVMTSAGIWSYDVQSGKELMLSTGPGTGMDYVALSPDLRTYAIGHKSGIELWDIQSDQLKDKFEGHGKSTRSVTFSPDGKMITSSDKGIIRIWEIENGAHRDIATTHQTVDRLVFSPDGKTLVSSGSADVRLWNTATGKFKCGLEDTTGGDNIIYSSDGSILFGIRNREVRFWDPDTGKIGVKLEFDRLLDYFHTPFDLSPDGKTFAIEGTNDYTVDLYDTQTGQLKQSLTGDPAYRKGKIMSNGVPKWVDYATKGVVSVAFSPDGQILAVGSEGEIVLWDHGSGTCKLTLTGKGKFCNLRFSPNGSNIIARNRSTKDVEDIYLWNIDTVEKNDCKPQYTIKDHSSEIFSIAFNPDGKTLVSAHNFEKMRLWDVTNGQLKATSSGYQWQTMIRSTAFSPNGDIFVGLSINSPTSYNKPSILLWDATTGEYQSSLNGHDEALRNSRPYGYGGGIAFSADGKTLISGGSDGTVRLWNMKTERGKATGNLKATLKGHTASVFCVGLSPDGNIIASGSEDKTVRLWDLRHRKLIATLEGHTNSILSVAFNPNGSTLATGSRDGSIHLWDSTTGKHKASLKGNRLFTEPASLPRQKDEPAYIKGYSRGPVNSILFSPDGKTLISGSAMNIYFWDMNTHRIKSTVSGHQGLFTLALSPDGRTLASGSSNGTVLIWDVNP